MPPMELLPAYNVVTNQMSSDASRLIFILMDRSIEPERPMIVARQIADAAVDAMEPGDLAAIVTTGVQGVAQNLTSDRARLHQTIASTDWSQRLSKAHDGRPEVVAALDMNDVGAATADACAGCASWIPSRMIANAVRDVPRRKVLLFIGEGLTVQSGDVECSTPRPRFAGETLRRTRHVRFDRALDRSARDGERRPGDARARCATASSTATAGCSTSN